MLSDQQDRPWYAAYTRPRFEKVAYSRLCALGIEAYLPLQRRLKQWSDRKKWVEEPLFKSYIFVRVSPSERFTVLQTHGVVRYVTFEGKAARIPERQIEQLKRMLDQHIELEEAPAPLEPGDRVEIRTGQLAGIEGEIIKHMGRRMVLIRIDHITHGLLATLPANSMVKKL